jgi:tetratricopeptide (TPR) repeat protein
LTNNNLNEARKQLNLAKEVDPSHEDVVRLEEQIETAASRLEAAEQAMAEKKANYEKYVSQGDEALGNGNYNEAITAYEAAIAMATGDNVANEKLAEAKSAKQKAQAEANQNAEEQAKQKAFDELMAQGNDFYDNFNYDEAIAKYKEALQIIPNSSAADKRIADAEFEKQKLKDELEREEKARKEAQLAANRKKKASFKEERINDTEERLDKIKFMNDLGREYPQGVTEEVINEDGYDITRRVVVESGVGAEYLKIKHNWGGIFYFKNGESTSQWVWQIETNDVY